MNDLKTAIVTGAGSGIGRATCIRLARLDYNIILTSRTQDALEQTAEQCEGQGEILVMPADLTSSEQARELVRAGYEAFGNVDVLANVAGYAPLQHFADITEEIWRRTIDTNLSYVVFMTSELFAQRRKRELTTNCVIINVSSISSFDPFPGLNIYAAAKAGLNMLTFATGAEGAGENVSAVAIAPGAVETRMLRDHFGLDMLPVDRVLPPDAVAQLICACATGDRAFESGEVIQFPSP